jgi:membrane-associated phospholipid phosphatase
LITYFLKIYLARARPMGGLLIEESFSFPSGHATVAFGVYGFLLYLSASYFFLRKKRLYFYLSTFIFLLIILFIGLSRLYLGVHYATDVLFGYLVGFCGVLLGIYFLKNINVNFYGKNKKGFTLI